MAKKIFFLKLVAFPIGDANRKEKDESNRTYRQGLKVNLLARNHGCRRLLIVHILQIMQANITKYCSL